MRNGTIGARATSGRVTRRLPGTRRDIEVIENANRAPIHLRRKLAWSSDRQGADSLSQRTFMPNLLRRRHCQPAAPDPWSLRDDARERNHAD